MSHPILVEGQYQDSPTKDPENYPASVLVSLLDDLRNQLWRPPGSIWLQPKNDPQSFLQESSRLTPVINNEEQARRCEYYRTHKTLFSVQKNMQNCYRPQEKRRVTTQWMEQYQRNT